MIWKDFKSSVINLGFEESDVFEGSERHLIEAANRALAFICALVEEKKRVTHIDIPATDEYYSVDLTEIVDYDSPAEIPPKIKGVPCGDYYYEEDILYIKAPGENVSITYNASPEFIPYDVLESYIIRLKKNLIPILELLTAHYIWLDDDEKKAVNYYNQAQDKINLYLNSKSKRERDTFIATVRGGVDI